MAEVTHICKRTVVSTKPVEPGKHYTFSVLDRLMEKNHLKIVYYFQTPKRKEAGEMTKKLRESLSETLTSYPEVTGRLVKDQEGNWMIKCNDAGVRMVEARVKGSVEEWLKMVDREKELMLIHWEEMFHKPYFWSTFYVQVTEFEEGGLAIGLSCTHFLADPTCVTMFIKAWAVTTLQGKIINPPCFLPFPQRNTKPNHKPSSHLINYYKSVPERTDTVDPKKYATVALAFTDPMVRACMAMARTTNEADPSIPYPSPFEALSGLFWVCLSKVKAVENGLINMSICLDTRKVVGLDNGYFGNCVVYNRVQTDSLQVYDIPNAAIAIGKVMAEMDHEGIMDFVEWLEHNDCQPPSPLINGCDLICASLEGENPYLAMFEQGIAPVRVSYYIEPVKGMGQVLILPSPQGEGSLSRVVMVTIPEDEVAKLCRDDLILQFSPTILMGMC
ncbi:hypothetical protein Tsubulata_047488 [Turnera subulata]|uniref:Protein ECERIFERUM 26-like n=1 Tax=Turnera subulata TaxID=218843 RepID=A0A9Q0G422_9ROSI|nr:hypothetical protein Tsubulata_047488 [Turnera subulata]